MAEDIRGEDNRKDDINEESNDALCEAASQGKHSVDDDAACDNGVA